MSIFNKWVRIIHRWLVVPFATAITILIIGTIQAGADYVSPIWLGVLGIGSILLLALTGLVMFVTHYLVARLLPSTCRFNPVKRKHSLWNPFACSLLMTRPLPAAA